MVNVAILAILQSSDDHTTYNMWLTYHSVLQQLAGGSLVVIPCVLH